MNFLYSAYFKHFILLIFLGLSFFAEAQDCADVVIPSLPYSEISTTCGAGNDVSTTNACNSWMVTGEDVIYSYTTTDETCLLVNLSGYEVGAAGMIVTIGCPGNMASSCVTTIMSDWNATSLSSTISAQPNTTYYFTVSSDDWTASCIDYDFSLSSDCPSPDAGDCMGAVTICNDFYHEENAPDGSGNYIDNLALNDCEIGAVDNSGWYTLTAQTDGILNFTLSPLQDDDYDWALFNLTDHSCAELSTNPDLLVSCNTYGLIGSNTETGISTANGGTGNSNGPGDLNGPPFNADINILAGETYVLLVSNWSGTTNGYELDFSESSATFIDDVPPTVESVTASCNGLVVEFSEYMDCTTALPAYFNVEGPNGTYTVTAIQSTCQEGLAYAHTFNLTLDTPFPAEGGDFQIVFNANELSDLCGNFLEPVTVPFSVATGMELDATTTAAACANDNGSLTVSVVSGGLAPFTYSLDGGPFQNGGTFDNLGAADYTVTVKDGGGCENTIDVTVDVDAVEFTAGVDTYACQLSFSGNATLPAGYTGVWTAPAGVQMNDATNTHCAFHPQTAGTYTLTWTITNGVNCTVGKSIDVAFNAVSVANFIFTEPTCHDKCDATAEVTAGGANNMAAVEYEWSGGLSSPATPASANHLCPGINKVTLTTEEGCSLSYPFTLENPTPLDIGEVTVMPEVCPKACDGSIAIEGSAAAEYSFDGGATFSSASSQENLCAGRYYMILKNSGGCAVDTLVNVGQPAGPRARFAAEPYRQSTFTPHFSFDNLSENYISSYWLFDYPDGSDFSRKQDPTYTYTDPKVGDYTVMLVVTDDHGCPDTTFHHVGIFEDTWVYIPNSFTPNGDGLNDIFRPVVRNVVVDDYKFQVFNRWGQTVFETDDVAKGWNGSVSGGAYYGEMGNYAYRIHVRDLETGEAREWNGVVLMVR